MIKYYAYYNHGGYKDLYLGSNKDTVDSRYFLPLLSVYENDESMSEKVAEWRELPAIINLSTNTSEYNYPTEARVMMSHAGYKLQYRHFDTKGVFALRDVCGNKDSYGRTCPFVMMMVGDTMEDKRYLEVVCYHVWKNLDAAEAFFCGLFVNDFEVNGLRFDVSKLNEWLREILSTTDGALEENTYSCPVHFFVVPDGMRFASAFEEQQVSKDQVAIAYNLGNTREYTYTPPQVKPESPGDPPPCSKLTQDNPTRTEEQPSQHHSIRNALGFAKAGDLESLVKKIQELTNRIYELEQRVQDLETK